MHTRSNLGSMLQRWEVLTSSETDAIEAEAWDALTEVQRQKVSLKAELAAVDAPMTAALRGLVARLVEMERRNLESLGQRMETLQRQLSALDETHSTLKRVHRSYAGSARLAATFNGTA